MAVGRAHLAWLMTNVLISLLTIGQHPLLAPKGHFKALATCPPLTDDLSMVTYFKRREMQKISYIISFFFFFRGGLYPLLRTHT